MNYIPIGKISSFIGEHNYCSFEQTLADVLSTTHKTVWNDLVRCYQEDLYIYQPQLELILEKFPKLKTDPEKSATQNVQTLMLKEKVRKFLETVSEESFSEEPVQTKKDVEDHVKGLIEKTKEYKKYTSTDVEEFGLIEEIADEHGIDKKIVKSVVVKDRGTVLESSTIDHLKQQCDKYNKYEEQMVARKTLVTDSDPYILYTINGRMDLAAFTAGELRCIFEVKNRTSEFLHEHPPRYDMIQLYTYMYIMNKCKGKLVSQYNGDVIIHETVTRKYAVKEFEEVIKPALDDAMERANHLIRDKYSLEMMNIVGNSICN